MNELERHKVIDRIFEDERLKDRYCQRRKQFVDHFATLPEEEHPDGLNEFLEILGQYDDEGFGAMRLLRVVPAENGTIHVSHVTAEEAQDLMEIMEVFLPSDETGV